MKIKRKINNTPVINVKKYGGKQVAILNGKIIASAKNLDGLLNKTKKIAKNKSMSEIKIFSVPKTLSVIYYVSR